MISTHQTLCLTNTYLAFILFALSPTLVTDGICSPDNQGHNGPLSTVVFLCPHQTLAALCRLFSIMAGCIGQPLKRLAGSLAGTANLIQSATRCFAALSGGYPLYQGVTA